MKDYLENTTNLKNDINSANLIECEVYKKQFTKYQALALHLNKYHNIKPQTYYDTYIDNTIKICPICNKLKLITNL